MIDYRQDYETHLSLALSFGHAAGFAPRVIEQRISRSSFFSRLEEENVLIPPNETPENLIDKMFPDANRRYEGLVQYGQCAWLAELYLDIQKKTGLTFEAMFLYLPLLDGYKLFPLYHEMDFSQAEKEFERRYLASTILNEAMKRGKYTSSELAQGTVISVSMVNSLRQGKRDLRLLRGDKLLLMAKMLNLRPETLLGSFYQEQNA